SFFDRVGANQREIYSAAVITDFDHHLSALMIGVQINGAAKPARGTVYLNAYHQGTQVVIEVRDDGRGIDLTLVRAHAVKKGVVKPEEAERMSDQDALNLIFESGFSTAREVTEVSGRGIGMDVVRTVMDRLKGS